ncbi:hypothetical protein DL346_27695 [Paenibacillus montanisoli]|uniref:Uncharacterized protein n=1 Tax=Paenibacillus montanisoli TaxID=2081970 RepID=A0A328TSB9_9BACL|nr:hypothetical protein DL346_27695 [Paenibacillus montanisoli]
MNESNKLYEQLAFFRIIRLQTVSFAVRAHSINQESLAALNTGYGGSALAGRIQSKRGSILRFFFLPLVIGDSLLFPEK